MKIINKNISLILIAGIIFNSCATIFNGPTQKIKITSTPPGAEVIINGENTQETTPCKIRVDRRVKPNEYTERNHQTYVLKKDGYLPYEYSNKSSFNPWSILSILYVYPFLIDWATGSHLKYSKEIHGSLNKNNVVVKTEKVFVSDNNKNTRYHFAKKSDIDINIPKNLEKHPYRFALIIGNEDYSTFQLDLGDEINVDYARNDASAFNEYAINTLGIPERNITFLLDATSGQMQQALAKINLLSKSTTGKAEIFFYYAGHGLPDEITKETYIMPVDISGSNVSRGIKIKSIYKILTEYPNKNVTVFIDACFSGGARNQGLLAARGVKIKPKVNELSGNLVVFSASSERQSALAYKNKEHGLFTYFLLKKLQESSGNLSYKELSNYLKEKISVESLIINNKEQTPQINISPTIDKNWTDWNLK
ncbi:MAG: caspase family protein [Bacteroidota bacterium]|nr:caspase family protein [Bacteroidota bacterium]